MPDLVKGDSVFGLDAHPLEEGLGPRRVELDVAAVLVERSGIVLHQDLQ